jgi:hypothetical protein
MNEVAHQQPMVSIVWIVDFADDLAGCRLPGLSRIRRRQKSLSGAQIRARYLTVDWRWR